MKHKTGDTLFLKPKSDFYGLKNRKGFVSFIFSNGASLEISKKTLNYRNIICSLVFFDTFSYRTVLTEKKSNLFDEEQIL